MNTINEKKTQAKKDRETPERGRFAARAPANPEKAPKRNIIIPIF